MTIAGPAQIYNGWARGYAPRVAAGADGRPSISPTAHLYFIQRWESRAYDEFVRAGLSTPPAVAAAIRTEPAGRPAFLVGPFSGEAVDTIRSRLNVGRDGLARFVHGPHAINGTAAR